ncbi:hypothetical protein AJ88_15770 [Mesorhizobium amorphae CCBAU 01583]|nr:hypothetical protein AJ88_15770 [Mesorhizobium amorphae CCBAU 01583]
MRTLLPDNKLGDPIPQFRRQQDEYLEWHVDRASNGAIQRITFTAEPPDYWEALASIAPDRVLELYRKHVSPNIQKSELFYPDRVVVFGQFSDGTRDWIEVPSLGGNTTR